jgi:hypothetical protein
VIANDAPQEVHAQQRHRGHRPHLGGELMPKRFVEDTIYTSDKLLSVPEKYRPEYSYILPLAEANGCLEYNPAVVWRTAYSLMRPSWNVKKVTAMLEAFREAKLLFVFEHAGKEFAYFIGIENGRLPKPSERVRFRNATSIVPAEDLATFLGISIEKTKEQYRDVIATASPDGRDDVAHSIGAGAGVRDGDGARDGVGSSARLGAGAESGAEAPVVATLSPITSSLREGQKEQKASAATSASASAKASEALRLAEKFHTLVLKNEHADSKATPKVWKKLWSEDFAKLLDTFSFDACCRLVEFSQAPSQAKYNVRAEKLVSNSALLADKFKIPTRSEEAAGRKVPAAVRDTQASNIYNDLAAAAAATANRSKLEFPTVCVSCYEPLKNLKEYDDHDCEVDG